MGKQHLVQIIAAPVICSSNSKNSWREVAHWAGGQLHRRLGKEVNTEYFDFFDPGCPMLPTDAQLPVILIDGQFLSGGGKISIPAILRKIAESEI